MATPTNAPNTATRQGAVTLNRPAAGQQIAVPAGSQALLLGFGLDEATLLQDGNNLVFQFDDGGTIVLQGFVDSLTAGDAPSLTLEDGTVLDGQAFATMQGLEIEAAAGPGTTSGGSGEYSDDPGLLYDGIDPLDPIGNVDFLNPVPEGPLDEEGLDPADGGTTPASPTPTLIVGSNYDDNSAGTDTHTRQVDNADTPVPTGSGTITGTETGDILIGDATPLAQNANVLVMIDMSTSMRVDGYDAAKTALANLINDYKGDGTVNLAAATFGYDALQTTPVSINLAAADINAEIDRVLNELSMHIPPVAVQGTNYEAAFATGHDWFTAQLGDPAFAGNSNTMLFVTDGAPTVYTMDSGHIGGKGVSGTITNQPDVDQGIGAFNTLVALGVDVHTFLIGNYQPTFDSSENVLPTPPPADPALWIADQVDNTGGAEKVTPPDLSEALDDVPQLLGSDLIEGGDGNDLLFGDVLNTDGITSITPGIDIGPQEPGQGWTIFEKLVAAGETWENVINYINDNHEQLATDSQYGGEDTIIGGAGNDIIYGQSGNDSIDGGDGDDLISGGAGNDILVGGTGADTFIWADGDQGVKEAPAHDTIDGFVVGEDTINLSDLISGVSQDADLLNNITVENVGNDTRITIHADGSPADVVQEITIADVNVTTNDLGDKLNELNILLANP